MDQGQKISTLRKEKGLTQAELGAELNVTFQAVSKWERGESYPDFATLSKLAKLFEVPIIYFEDNGEELVKEAATTAQASADLLAEAKAQNSTMVGVCKECGKVVYKDDLASSSPYILCNECNDAILAIKEKEAQKLREEQKKAEQEAEIAQIINRKKIRRTRNKGLIWAAVICGIIIALTISGLVSDPTDIFITIIGLVVITLFLYTYIAQLFWPGKVRRITLTGGKIIGTPGVIFTLDLDGIFFLIAIKILFAVLRFVIFIIGSLFFILIAIIVSPFTFIPQLIKLNNDELDDED